MIRNRLTVNTGDPAALLAYAGSHRQVFDLEKIVPFPDNPDEVFQDYLGLKLWYRKYRGTQNVTDTSVTFLTSEPPVLVTYHFSSEALIDPALIVLSRKLLEDHFCHEWWDAPEMCKGESVFMRGYRTKATTSAYRPRKRL